MKKPTIEQRILAARPPRSKNNTQFTDAVMSKIKSRREIFSQQIRTTNVNQKETFIMKLRNLHKPAIIAIALALTLATAGTAYAIYQLWPKPSVDVSTPVQNKQGRLESAVQLKNCGNQQSNQASYEIKKGSTISADEVPQILQAYCEIEAISAWSLTFYTPPEPGDETSTESRMLSPVFVSRIASIDDSTVTLEAQKKYGIDESVLKLDSKVKYIADSAYSDKSQFKAGDPVVALSHDTINPDTSRIASQKLVFLIRMNLPFEAYDPRVQQSVAQKQVCINNAPDICTSTGSVDLYSGDAKLPNGKNGDFGDTRVIQGKIVSYSGTSIMVEGSSGRQFSFVMTSNPIDEYNKKRSALYNNVTVGVGDMIEIRYLDTEGSTSLKATQKQIAAMNYMIELVGKSDPLKKY